MNSTVLRYILANEETKMANIYWDVAKAPFQALGSKASRGRFDIPEEVVREQTSRNYMGVPLILQGAARGLDKRYLTPYRQMGSDANAAVGAGTVLGAAGLYAGGKMLARAAKNRIGKAQRYRDEAGAVESFGSRIRGENLSPKNARGNLAAGYGTIGGVGLGGYGISNMINRNKEASLLTLPFKAAKAPFSIASGIAGKGIDAGRGAGGYIQELIGSHRHNSVNAIDTLGAKLRGGSWDPSRITEAERQLNRRLGVGTIGGAGLLGYSIDKG